jgi:hypothetical protein
MSIETRLLNFKTADRETLHGLLFTPRESKSDLALLFVHGVANNFYLPPFRRLDKNSLIAAITAS